jgi:hypothetical protein
MTLPTIDDIMRADRVVDRIDDHYPMSQAGRSMLRNELAALFDEVRHEEREACAKVCADYAEDYRQKAAGTTEPLLLGSFRHRNIAACDCEAAIRGRRPAKATDRG